VEVLEEGAGRALERWGDLRKLCFIAAQGLVGGGGGRKGDGIVKV